MSSTNLLNSVYGPVQSWRFGRSLGIDPIGAISTCSFDCVYCQLGQIERQTGDRQVFVPTIQILKDLQQFSPWNVDVITVSGSGEPTLAANLGEILSSTKAMTGKPIGVLTNGSLLRHPLVQRDLAIATWVAVKVDGVTQAQVRRVNRPLDSFDLSACWASIWEFRQQYGGHLAIQTMLLSPWNEQEQADYLALMRFLAPDEIQLNTPTRPRPAHREVEARGNHSACPYPAKPLKLLSSEVLRQVSDRLEQTLGIPTRYPPSLI